MLIFVFKKINSLRACQNKLISHKTTALLFFFLKKGKQLVIYSKANVSLTNITLFLLVFCFHLNSKHLSNWRLKKTLLLPQFLLFLFALSLLTLIFSHVLFCFSMHVWNKKKLLKQREKCLNCVSTFIANRSFNRFQMT